MFLMLKILFFARMCTRPGRWKQKTKKQELSSPLSARPSNSNNSPTSEFRKWRRRLTFGTESDRSRPPRWRHSGEWIYSTRRRSAADGRKTRSIDVRYAVQRRREIAKRSEEGSTSNPSPKRRELLLQTQDACALGVRTGRRLEATTATPGRRAVSARYDTMR